MEKVFAFLSVVSFNSMLARALGYGDQVMTGLYILCTILIIYIVERRTRHSRKKMLFSFRIKFSVLKFLLMKNSSLKNERDLLKSEVENLNAEIKNIISTWAPKRPSTKPNAYISINKDYPLAGLSFAETQKVQHEGFNESFSAEH